MNALFTKEDMADSYKIDIETMIFAWNRKNGIPAPGHTSYCKIAGATLNLDTDLVTVSFNEVYHGRVLNEQRQFRTLKDFTNWFNAHMDVVADYLPRIPMEFRNKLNVLLEGV